MEVQERRFVVQIRGLSQRSARRNIQYKPSMTQEEEEKKKGKGEYICICAPEYSSTRDRS
jgi:hypothetical protein